MPAQCTTCAHAARLDIDAAIAQGESTESIAARYGLAGRSVRSHRTNHTTSPRRINPVLKRLERLYRDAARGLEHGEPTKDKIAAMDQLRKTLDSIARVRGDTGAQQVTIVQQLGVTLETAQQRMRRVEECEGLTQPELASRAQAYLRDYNQAHPDQALYVERPRPRTRLMPPAEASD